MKHFNAKHTIITGALLLSIAGVLARIIGFFYRIFLSRTIGAEGLGIYQLVFPVMSICFSLTSASIQTTLSKYVSTEIGNENPKGAYLYLYLGLMISSLLSVITGLILWNYAPFIAEKMFGEIRCIPLLKILSFSLLPSSIHACINGYCYGKKQASIPAFSQLVEQFVRVGSVYLIYIIIQCQGMEMTIPMAMWGITLSEIGGMLFSISFVRLGKAKGSVSLALKNMVQMTVPLTSNRLLINILGTVENVMIPVSLRAFGYTSSEALSVYGILTGMAFAIITAPSVFTNSISVLLLPAISEAQAKQNHFLIQKTIQKTIYSCLLLGFLCTFGFLATGDFIGNVVFCNSLAGTFIVTMSWMCPFLYLNTTLSSILNGLGHANITFFFNLLGSIIRIIFVIFVIPMIGLKGYLYGLFVSQILFSALAVIFLKKKTVHPISKRKS